MTKSAGKNNWALFLLLLAGIVIGSFAAKMTAEIPYLSWLSYGLKFGITSPLKLDLGVLTMTFAITIKITLGSIIGMIIAAIVYKFI